MSKKIIRRESILQAAIDVFSKQDCKTASISEIAQKAGVANGTIYQYFSNKEDLFFAIPVEKTNEFRSQLELHLEGISGAFTTRSGNSCGTFCIFSRRTPAMDEY